ncbi:hypothetical protein ACFR99_06810 [Haloarchaeobius amylolyticus]|uniref:Uncharacterized protein n=1 Tax=Haloarchaeobius amylolyticus TaxID=1198296 RepID=A0ABD6BEV0_9EURY
MNKVTSTFLVVLLILSVPSVTVTAAAPAPEDGSHASVQRNPSLQTDVTNTTNRLELDDDVRSEHTNSATGLGTTLASADDELRVDHGQYVLVDDEFAEASAEERAAMLETAYERLTRQADELEERERTAVREHAAGERSSAALLQTLLRNQNEAVALSQQISVIDDRAERVPDYSLSASQIRAEDKALESHQTVLRSNLERNLPAENDPHKVLISTTQNGYSISMIDGNQYLVERSRFDNRAESGSDRFENGEAYDHIDELYPWASEFGPHFQDNSPDYYWAEIAHDQGRLEFYFDSETGDVYREIQELSVPTLPTVDNQTWSRDELEMTITKTPANGPLEVEVTDSETGDPVQATITVDGVELGMTDEDGHLWIVQPQNDYRLKAETTTESVNATITGGT